VTDTPLDLGSDEARDRLLRLFRYGQVGRCVSSVTHDLNNYLGVVLAYCELVSIDSTVGEESRRMVSEAVQNVRICAKMLSTLTSVARKERPDVRVIDVPATLKDLFELKQYDFRIMLAHVDTQFDEGIPSLVVDYPRFAMAFLHLVMNALESIAGLDKPSVRLHLRKEADGIAIEIWDSGPPLAEDEKTRVFDPFYTTKTGEHLGLGLAVARENARYHGGDLTYDPDHGFTLRIPFATGLSSD